MSTVAQMIARTEDRWPDASEVPDDALGQVLLASHLLGADRAVANFGGGNTSAKGTATDHVGREVDGHVGEGLGLATSRRWSAGTSRRCGSTRCCRCSSATR